MKRSKGTMGDAGAERLSSLAKRGERLSDRIGELVFGSNVFVALFALGVSAKEAACTDEVTAEESAIETLYALQFVRSVMAERPEWAADVLGFARFLGDCLSTLAAESGYRPSVVAIPGEPS